jgi:hypothetical protein
LASRRKTARCARPSPGFLVGEHHVRIADPDLGVADFPAGRGHAQHFDGAESLLVELERARGVVEHEIGSDAVITLGNGLDGHEMSPFESRVRDDFFGYAEQ